MWRRGIATGLLVVLAWTGQALAWPGRSCMCSGDPLPPGLGGPGLGGQQIEGLGGTAGRGWVMYHGVWIPPEVAGTLAKSAGKVTVKGTVEEAKLWWDVGKFVITILVGEAVLYHWLKGDVTTAQIQHWFEQWLQKQGWVLP